MYVLCANPIWPNFIQCALVVYGIEIQDQGMEVRMRAHHTSISFECVAAKQTNTSSTYYYTYSALLAPRARRRLATVLTGYVVVFLKRVQQR